MDRGVPSLDRGLTARSDRDGHRMLTERSFVADRAIGLKMKVIAFDPFLEPERAVKIGVEKVELEQLLWWPK